MMFVSPELLRLFSHRGLQVESTPNIIHEEKWKCLIFSPVFSKQFDDQQKNQLWELGWSEEEDVEDVVIIFCSRFMRRGDICVWTGVCPSVGSSPRTQFQGRSQVSVTKRAEIHQPEKSRSTKCCMVTRCFRDANRNAWNSSLETKNEQKSKLRFKVRTAPFVPLSQTTPSTSPVTFT